MSITKRKLSNTLSERTQVGQKLAQTIVEDFFSCIRNALESQEDVKLSGFGNFVLREKAERVGRNPKTGEEVIVTARTVVTFKGGKKLKNYINSKE